MRPCCAAAWKRDEGQALIEYSLILALVAAGLLAVLLLFRNSLGNSYQTVGGQVDAAGLPVASPDGGAPGSGRATGGSADGGGPAYPGPAGAGRDGKGHYGCGGGQGGGLGRGGGGGCGGGTDR